MRIRLAIVLTVALAGSLTLSLIRGQERSTPLPPAPAPAAPAARPAPLRDLSRLTELQKQLLLACQRGADWLYRMNGVKGRFLPGYLPALQTELEGDHYLRQVGAACALARAARFTGEERYAARATQAVLALLDDTTTDPDDARARYPALPPVVVNRLEAAGLLVQAINELPAPQTDLLDKSEQLCHYLRRQARPDGSLDPGPADGAAALNCAGPALHGLMLSQKHRPAGWKTDLVRKALAYYRPRWQAHKTLVNLGAQTAACAEAYLRTHEPAFADFAFAMCDWLCELQYTQIDPRHLLWCGGFMDYADGRAVEAPPQVDCAAHAEALAEACRVAAEKGDAVRHQRYREALERCLQFVATLQYTDANTQHFAAWYRSRLVGAFHASHQDGNLRLDHTQHAVAALVQYLEYVAGR
jgi:hypothetical protein